MRKFNFCSQEKSSAILNLYHKKKTFLETYFYRRKLFFSGQGPQKPNSLKSLKLNRKERPQTSEIWPKQLNVTLCVSEGGRDCVTL